MQALYDTQTATVVTTWDTLPAHVVWPDGASTHAAAPGHLHADRWLLCPASYADAGKPTQWHSEASRLVAFVGGNSVEITRVWQPPANLEQMRAGYKAMVDADAERVRLKYITPGDGMQMTYREKLEQAEDLIALGQVAADALTAEQAKTQYPTLAASVGLEAQTLYACAVLVRDKYLQFAALSHEIEKTRLSGKVAIEAAQTAESIASAYASITWTV